MKHGHWIPISKGFKRSLPHDREYTELEAAYSLQLDYDCKSTVTVAGYSDLWRWSRGRVYRFLDRMNIKILYPEDVKIKQNQSGQIAVQITDRCRTDNGQIRLIENSDLQTQIDRKRTDNGQITDRSQNTTIKPKNLKPKKENRKTKISTDFILTNELKNYALKKGILKNELSDIFEHFKNHHGAKGSLMFDWNKCWYTWVRNEIKFNPEKYADRKEFSQESIEDLIN